MCALSQASPSDYQQGLTWYLEAHCFARELGKRHNIHLHKAAGIIAVLSPSITWEQNRKAAEALCVDQSATVGAYGANVRKALALLNDAPVNRIVSGPKVRAFWLLIVNPLNSKLVCVDRHAVRIATGRKLDLNDCNVALSRVGSYDRVANCYRRVAKTVNLLPHQVQAITWCAYRKWA